MMMSAGGQTVRIRAADLRVLSRNTQGVKLVNLKDDKDYLTAIQKVDTEQESSEGESTSEA